MTAAKAAVGAASASVTSLIAGSLDGSLSLTDILVAVGAGLVALGAVYSTPNKTS